jgi:hypothetical protein
MSRGIGKTQQRILDELVSIEQPPVQLIPWPQDYALTVMDLAHRIGISDRQVRHAVRSLEDRELVVITRGSVWHGVGQYGPLVRRKSLFNDYGPDVPTAQVIGRGERWPWKEGYVAARDVELVYAGMPTPALLVWLPGNRVAYLAADSQSRIRFGGMPTVEILEEYGRLTGMGEDFAQKFAGAMK